MQPFSAFSFLLTKLICQPRNDRSSILLLSGRCDSWFEFESPIARVTNSFLKPISKWRFKLPRRHAVVLAPGAVAIILRKHFENTFYLLTSLLLRNFTLFNLSHPPPPPKLQANSRRDLSQWYTNEYRFTRKSSTSLRTAICLNRNTQRSRWNWSRWNSRTEVAIIVFRVVAYAASFRRRCYLPILYLHVFRRRQFMIPSISHSIIIRWRLSCTKSM